NMISLAIGYAACGRHAEALQLLDERRALQAKIGPDGPDMLYNIACLHATIAKSSNHPKQGDVAIGLFRQALAAGVKQLQLMKTDPELDALRGREDFKRLVADLEAEIAKQKK